MLWLPTYGRLDERLIGRLSLGPGQWLWLFKRSGQGQSQPRPTFWPGLAWPDFRLAWLGFWLQAKASTALDLFVIKNEERLPQDIVEAIAQGM